MNPLATMALACVAVCLATTGCGQQGAVKPASTNSVTVISVKTNILAIVRGGETNFVLQITEEHSDGGCRIKSSLLPSDAISIDDTHIGIFPLGDFWLPGEFEKMREEKRQQRRQQKK